MASDAEKVDMPETVPFVAAASQISASLAADALIPDLSRPG
jgi:hypothetical protein